MLLKKKLNPEQKEDIYELKKFIENNPESCKTFRYFSSRPFEIIKNHLETILYFIDDECVGYGHLDKEDNKIWLGIMVSDSYHSKGLGNKIMDHLLSLHSDEIFLTVDKVNDKGVNLYKKKNFVILKENEKNYLMVFKNNINMADTLGNVIDKLITVDMKMWDNQELLYEIRRMTFDEYKNKYFLDEGGAVKLWEILKKACDLNVQRNQLINEVDEKLIEMMNSLKNNENLDNGKFLQRSHKTY